MKRTLQKFQMTCVTLTFRPSGTYYHLVSCVYALYQANRSNRHRMDMWPWLFDLEVVWRIVPLWVLFVPHMKWIGQIAMEQISQKASNNPCDFDHWHFFGYMWKIWIGQIGTEPWIGHNKNFEQFVWPLTFQPDFFCKIHENPVIGTWKKEAVRLTDGQTDTHIDRWSLFIELLAATGNALIENIIFQFYPYTYFW